MSRFHAAFAASALGFALASHASQTAAGWSPFRNRTGWRIQYPSTWRYFSCQTCRDPTLTDGYVRFVPADTTQPGMVSVEHLQDKPPHRATAAWLAELEHADNLNPVVWEAAASVNGLRGRTVRYRNDIARVEMEVTYVVQGVRTYAIKFDAEQPGRRAEDLPSYIVFQHMRASFATGPSGR